MQEIEFVNDLCCNYLTVPYDGEETDFAIRMLTENVTDGFLPLEVRRLDGQTYLYYNISGLQSMEVIYTEKTIDRETFRTFMWHLHEAIEQSRDLFLPGEGICLAPSALFWNLGTQRWEFVYIPGQDKREIEETQSEKEQLAEFLVMRIDYADKELTDAAYRFYEEICAGRMYPELFLNREELKCGEEREDEQGQEIWEREDVDEEDREMEEAEVIKQENKVKTQKAKKTLDKKGIHRILLILWCTAAAAALLLGKTMNDVRLPGGAVVLLAVIILYTRIKQKCSGNDPVSGPADTIYAEEENTYISYETESNEIKDTAEEEKTVYMDIRQEQERKLYGIGKFRQQKIFLEGLPCTIGKDKELVSHIVPDASVSRMHARFFEEGKTVWMQDLNSTNGTYHNGLRLRPNEKVMLEPEDEVGFGRVQFIFR